MAHYSAYGRRWSATRSISTADGTEEEMVRGQQLVEIIVNGQPWPREKSRGRKPHDLNSTYPSQSSWVALRRSRASYHPVNVIVARSRSAPAGRAQWCLDVIDLLWKKSRTANF